MTKWLIISFTFLCSILEWLKNQSSLVVGVSDPFSPHCCETHWVTLCQSHYHLGLLWGCDGEGTDLNVAFSSLNKERDSQYSQPLNARAQSVNSFHRQQAKILSPSPTPLHTKFRSKTKTKATARGWKSSWKSLLPFFGFTTGFSFGGIKALFLSSCFLLIASACFA